MKEPKFTLIIGIDQNDKNYTDTVRQAQLQDYDNLEIIVVSNRLNEKEQIILDYFIHQDDLERSKHISLLNRECKSTLFNEGITCATGDYVWCIDTKVFFKDKSAITNVVSGLVQSKAQALYLSDQDALNVEKNTQIIGDQEIPFNLRHPLSILKQKDWRNASRIVIKLNCMRLFGLNFTEGWQQTNGALFSIQLIRFLSNIFYQKQDLIQFSETDEWNSFPHLIDFILSFNYTLRYSETIFGINSMQMKFILNREIKDTVLIFNQINRTNLNLKTKDYLKYSRKLILNSYLERVFDGQERSCLEEKVNKLAPRLSSKPHEMLQEIFRYSRIKVHCGAHKTATTYIQNILNEARYDLALQGVIYVHHEKLRDDFIKAKKEENIEIDFEKIAYSIIQQTAYLGYRSPVILIISEENLIRPHSDIFKKWRSKISHESAANYSCACIRNGYNIDHVKAVSDIFSGGIEIIYTIRNYIDYLLSRHSEFLKWRPFKEFDGNFIAKADLQKCNWEYLISDLRQISLTTSVHTFENYKKEPLQFANYLSEYDVSNYCIGETESQKINRSRASQQLLDELINKKNLGYDALDLKSIFSEKIEKEASESKKFASKLFSSEFIQKQRSKYEADCRKISVKDMHFDYDSLSNAHFCEKKFLKQLPLPERSNSPVVRNSRTSKSRLELIANESLFLENRDYSKLLNHGISAMIRVRNEENNIYNVLCSIQNCFDEIVVIDNNSTDSTISEINRAIMKFPTLKSKLKLRHYKFEIAKCGLENFLEPQNSPKSLASYYNYSLKQCSFSKVCKWDGDMFLPVTMEKYFQDYLRKISSAQPADEMSTVFGIMEGFTVYKGRNGKYYTRETNAEKEVRIFENIPGVFFIKEILWEQIFSIHKINNIISDSATFVELKDTNLDEFDHWSTSESLGLSPRKSMEINDFNIIRSTTQHNDENAIKSILQAHGFKEIDPTYLRIAD